MAKDGGRGTWSRTKEVCNKSQCNDNHSPTAMAPAPVTQPNSNGLYSCDSSTEWTPSFLLPLVIINQDELVLLIARNLGNGH